METAGRVQATASSAASTGTSSPVSQNDWHMIHAPPATADGGLARLITALGAAYRAMEQDQTHRAAASQATIAEVTCMERGAVICEHAKRWKRTTHHTPFQVVCGAVCAAVNGASHGLFDEFVVDVRRRCDEVAFPPAERDLVVATVLMLVDGKFADACLDEVKPSLQTFSLRQGGHDLSVHIGPREVAFVITVNFFPQLAECPDDPNVIAVASLKLSWSYVPLASRGIAVIDDAQPSDEDDDAFNVFAATLTRHPRPPNRATVIRVD